MNEIEKRAQFEAWAGDQGFILDRTAIGGDYDYQDLRTQGPWEAWQAALSAAPQAQDGVLRDAVRLDWLDRNGFSAYRSIDPIDGISKHCVVVHETMRPRRGNVADTIRESIDAAMAAAPSPERQG